MGGRVLPRGWKVTLGGVRLRWNFALPKNPAQVELRPPQNSAQVELRPPQKSGSGGTSPSPKIWLRWNFALPKIRLRWNFALPKIRLRWNFALPKNPAQVELRATDKFFPPMRLPSLITRGNPALRCSLPEVRSVGWYGFGAAKQKSGCCVFKSAVDRGIPDVDGFYDLQHPFFEDSECT